MSTLSTHVLDTGSGRPAAEMPVRLEAQSPGGEWKPMGQYITNSDGRVTDLTGKLTPVENGVYRLTFETQKYFSKQKQRCFYPYASVVFEIQGANEHYHVPLLISAWGYSTYRGS
jgi:5-hydroxyisourate hydrolase